MYSVWFCDLEIALKTFRRVCPNITCFTSIEGNAFGDFTFRTTAGTYCVSHTDFSVYKFEGTDWKDGHWVKIAEAQDPDGDDIQECLRQSLGDNWW